MSQEMLLVKLTNGDIILGVSSMNSGENIELERPVQLLIMHDPRGSGNTAMRFGDFMPGAKQSFFVFKDKDVLCVAEPQDELVELYNRIMNPSAIAVPEEGLILPS